MQKFLSIAFGLFLLTGLNPAFAKAVEDTNVLFASPAGFVSELDDFEAAITAYGESAVTLDSFIKLLAEREAAVATAQAKIAAARAAMRDPIQQLANFPNNSAAPARQAKVAEQVAIMLSAEAELIEAEKARDGARHVLDRIQTNVKAAQVKVVEIAIGAVTAEQTATDQMAEQLEMMTTGRDVTMKALEIVVAFLHEVCNDGIQEANTAICARLKGTPAEDASIIFIKRARDLHEN